MAAKNTRNTYDVSFRINVEVGVTLAAESLEAALVQAKNFKVSDVIDFNGNAHNDSDIAVTAVFSYIPVELKRT